MFKEEGAKIVIYDSSSRTINDLVEDFRFSLEHFRVKHLTSRISLVNRELELDFKREICDCSNTDNTSYITGKSGTIYKHKVYMMGFQDFSNILNVLDVLYQSINKDVTHTQTSDRVFVLRSPITFDVIQPSPTEKTGDYSSIFEDIRPNYTLRVRGVWVPKGDIKES